MKTRTRAVAALAAALIAAPGLAACGGGGDSDEAAATMETFFHSLGDKDADAACKKLTTNDGKKPLESDDKSFQECVKIFTMAMGSAKDKELDQLKNLSVKEAKVDGDTATIEPDQVEGLPDDMNNGSDEPAELVKIDGSWYLKATSNSSLGG